MRLVFVWSHHGHVDVVGGDEEDDVDDDASSIVRGAFRFHHNSEHIFQRVYVLFGLLPFHC